MTLKKLFPLATLVLAACNGGGGHHDDDIDAKDVAVIAGVAPDFSSGALSLVDVDAPHAASNGLNPTSSDIAVRADGDHFFELERFNHDTITRFEGNDTAHPTYTYSTNDAAAEPGVSSNPYDILTVSDTKAYLLRYGSPKIWIVNPSAATEAAFHTGSIDLSAYDTVGPPEMSAGIIRNGKLFVVMQRLNGFNADKTGYVAVIDTATDAEIVTGAAGAPLKGFELPVVNPGTIQATPDGHLMVLATGSFDGSFNGGLARIDTSAYTATLVQDDGDAATHPFGQFVDMAIVDDHRGYFIGDTNFTTQSLYRFDPSTTAAPVAVTGFTDAQLSTVAVSPNGALFVGRTDSSAPGLTILGFSGGTETVDTALVDTVLNPSSIDFITVETTPVAAR